jgi:hypothetical protein
MKFLVARRKTMHVFHASGQGFALNLLDPESEQHAFREVSSLRLPTNPEASNPEKPAELSFDLRASFGPIPQITRPALGNC